MINSAEAQKRIRETLVGFPPRTISAYQAFSEGGDAGNLDIVVLGVLHFYLAKKPVGTLDTLPGTTRLIEDLGCDSMTMLDTVFMVETLFNVRIDDQELTQLATLDDLRLYLRRLVKDGSPSTV
jgi:acyl carrier protein